jgi:hypothetical protein
LPGQSVYKDYMIEPLNRISHLADIMTWLVKHLWHTFEY